MGWASGSGIMDVVIKAAKKAIPNDKIRSDFYGPVIREFESEDCDTLGECMGKDPVFDAALKAANPGIYDEEE